MNYLRETEEILGAIARYTNSRTLWLDTEVADYDTKNPQLSLISILDDSTDLKSNKVILLDVLGKPQLIDTFITEIMVNPNIEKVFHNAQYDLKLLGKRKAQNITCTLKLVQQIPYYLAPLPNYKLKTVAEQLCHFPPIDKSLQGSDWKQRPLSEKQLEYAAMDAVYVSQVHHRLLQLNQLIEPNPDTEDVTELTQRYRQIEYRWKQLDSEINHLKERIKKAMTAQEVEESAGFKVSSYQRTTTSVSLLKLAQTMRNFGLDLDFNITLTKDMQDDLGDIIEELPIEQEIKTISLLKVADLEVEDIPF